MRLIDKDALIEAMGEEPYADLWDDYSLAERSQWLDDMALIENAPTIEPCEDAISREAVRKIIWNDLEINPNEDGMIFEAQSHIDRDIQLLPTVAPSRPSGEWIPCNERMPSDGIIVLVTVLFDDYGDVTLAFGSQYKEKWNLRTANDERINYGYTVLAWMPLPEPYKESE